ncbi:protoporphyrinogen oxidase HemJ [Methylophaga sp. OBS3]|nr:protoporphyrinogen oxidase HemJ [Methylophaga sp. OBS3]
MLWVKAFHLIFIVTWFASLFYLPRLFVYHAQTEDAAGNARFKIMERKLYRGIMTPSAILTVIFGGWLLSFYDLATLKTMGWLHAKLTLVLLLFIYHHVCGRYLKHFANDANTKSHVFYRWFNELPVLVLIAVVILAVVKPF